MRDPLIQPVTDPDAIVSVDLTRAQMDAVQRLIGRIKLGHKIWDTVDFTEAHGAYFALEFAMRESDPSELPAMLKPQAD